MFVQQEWADSVGLKMQSILPSGLRAPDAEVRDYAPVLYAEVAVELFHSVPETREQFLERRKDKRGGHE